MKIEFYGNINDKIRAIKQLRVLKDMSLIDAKNWVENAAQDALGTRTPATNTDCRRFPIVVTTHANREAISRILEYGSFKILDATTFTVTMTTSETTIDFKTTNVESKMTIANSIKIETVLQLIQELAKIDKE